jgi:hypothetical protein
MPRTKYTLWMMLGILIVSGCATIDTEHFARVTEQSIKYDVPLYYSAPPVGTAYRDLGLVTGTHVMGIFGSPFKALKDMSIKAKAKGANAVIDVKSTPAGFGQCAYQGEAVVFDQLPSI